MMLATKLDAIFKIAASAPANAPAAAPAAVSGNKSDAIFTKLADTLVNLSEDGRKEYASKVRGSFLFNVKVSPLYQYNY